MSIKKRELKNQKKMKNGLSLNIINKMNKIKIKSKNNNNKNNNNK